MSRTYTYLKDTLFNFSKYYEHTGQKSTLSVYDYKSIDWNNINLYLQNIDNSWYGETSIQPNTNLEKVSLDLYDDPNYWDVIMLVNGMSPLMDIPFEFDVISDTTQEKLDKYESEILKRTIPEDLRLNLYQQYEDEMITENNAMLSIKYILKERLYDFILGLYDLGIIVNSLEKNDVVGIETEE